MDLNPYPCNAASPNPGSVPVTVLILSKNEQLNIDRCLRSIAWAEQIIVVDSGSDDDTQRLVTQAGADLIRTTWRGFAAQREFALRLPRIRHDWVLFVDADEWTSPEFARAVETAVGQNTASGYWVHKRLIFQGRWIRHCGWYPSARIVVLMRRSAARFDTSVEFSEHAIISGNVSPLGEDIVDEDHKGLAAWLVKHVHYAELEAVHRGTSKGRPRRPQDSLVRHIVKDKIAPITPARPIVQFLYMYVLRRGFLDGRQGLSFCLYHSWFQWVVSDLDKERRRAL